MYGRGWNLAIALDLSMHNNNPKIKLHLGKWKPVTLGCPERNVKNSFKEAKSAEISVKLTRKSPWKDGYVIWVFEDF